MRVKSYRGPDLASALRKARGEMGAEAHVLSHRTVVSDVGLDVVELTVGVEEKQPIEEPIDELRRLADEVRRMQRREGVETFDVRSLLRDDLDPELTQQLARAIDQRRNGSRHGDQLARATAAAIRDVVPMRPWIEGPRVTLLVGPPGVGKSTTTAKLVARQEGRARAKTHLVQADRFRPGADAQASQLCRTVGARLDVLGDPSELGELRRRNRRHRIFVDTTGASSYERDPQRWEDLLLLRESAPDAETLLLLPAHLPRPMAARWIERFSPLSPTGLAMTSVDESPGDGVLIAAAKASLPLALTTDGQTIPDDLQSASAASIAELVLTPTAREELLH